jgi:hypothetical protein
VIDLDARVAALVARVDECWRRADYQDHALPVIAREALAVGDVFAGASGLDILAALAMRSTAASPGEPRGADAVTLFDGARFAVRVQVARDGGAPVHSAGHGGAFQVLAGPIAYGRFAFASRVEYDAGFALGALSCLGVEVVGPGAAIAVRPETIHAIGHLAPSGLLLRIESSERMGTPSVAYLPPGVRCVIGDHDMSLARRIKCFTALHRMDPAACAGHLETALADDDPRTCFHLIHHAASRLHGLDVGRLLAAAGAAFADHAGVVAAAIAGATRTPAAGGERAARLAALAQAWNSGL